MTDYLSAVKRGKKFKKESSTPRSFLYSGNSLTEFPNTGRLSSISGLRNHRLGSSNSLERLSFISETDAVCSYERYELDYSTYLMRKLQSRLLKNNKKEKEENFKRCLISLKFELEELLNKHISLNKTLAYIGMYMDTIKECNKRIELGKILKVFEKNKLDVWFKSVSAALDQRINQMLLVGLSKTDVETIFNQDVIGENSELFQCLKKIQTLSKKNKDKIHDIATEILKIQELFTENSILRERYQVVLHNIASDLLERNYEALTNVVKEACDKRLGWKNTSTSDDDEVLKIEKLLNNVLSIEQINSFSSSKVNSIFVDKPNGTSTPQLDHAKSCAM